MATKNEITIHSGAAEYLTFIAATGGNQDSIEMRYEDENIWLTQKMMATLYDVEINTVNYHIKKIYEDAELTENSTIRKFRIVQNEGNRNVSRDVIHYNLQMIMILVSIYMMQRERKLQRTLWLSTTAKKERISFLQGGLIRNEIMGSRRQRS